MVSVDAEVTIDFSGKLTSFLGPCGLVALSAMLFLSACATVDIHGSVPMDRDGSWTLLPILNHSSSPNAGRRVEALLTPLLQRTRLGKFQGYPNRQDALALPDFDDQRHFQSALDWARERKIRYAVAGSVVEWRYRASLEGEPAIAVSLRVVAVESGEVLWSASGAKSGWGKDSLGSTAQDLLREMVKSLNLNS